MAGKNVNQKVQDLIKAKIATLPKVQVRKEKMPAKLPKAQSSTGEKKIRTLNVEKKEKKLMPPSKLAAPSKFQAAVSEAKMASPSEKQTLGVPTPSSMSSLGPKPIKKFVRKASGQRKSFSKASNSSFRSKDSDHILERSPVPADAEPEFEEKKETVNNEKVTEAILTARPIEELVNLGNLDRTGDIIEKVLYGTIEEKVDALVLLNEVITTNLHESKESLIKNAEFISRTFADVLDGIFYRCQDDIPIKFVKYLVQVFKK